jgi:protein-S-isoprenylcysteine O-methyltransferase Ste14
MVDFEEAILEKMFGSRYLEYKKNVPKWIPRPYKKQRSTRQKDA